RDEIVVRRFHVEVVVPHAEAAISDVRAASRLPEVVPELVAVARIDCPGIVRRRDVEDAVHLEDRALDVRAGAGAELARAFAADDGRRSTAPAASASTAAASATAPASSGRDASHPG